MLPTNLLQAMPVHFILSPTNPLLITYPLSHQLSKNVNIYMITILKFDNIINFIVYLEPFENEKL